MELKEAKKILKEAGLEYELEYINDENTVENPIIINQLPKQGINVQEGTKIVLYVK